MKSQKRPPLWRGESCSYNKGRYYNGYNFDTKEYPGAQEARPGLDDYDKFNYQCEDTAGYGLFL
jgi:hypothetical protein